MSFYNSSPYHNHQGGYPPQHHQYTRYDDEEDDIAPPTNPYHQPREFLNTPLPHNNSSSYQPTPPTPSYHQYGDTRTPSSLTESMFHQQYQQQQQQPSKSPMDNQAFLPEHSEGVVAGDEKSPAKPRKSRRKCCGNGRYCFCCSKKCCCIFIPILVLILAGLGVTLYYVWPRIPSVTFDRIGVAQRNSDGKLVEMPDNGPALSQTGLNINRKGVVTVPLVIHLSVTNPNFIPWTLHNVTVDGFLKNSTAGGENFPVGEGGLLQPFKMPKKSTANDMPIFFNFRLETKDAGYDAAAHKVQAACAPGGPQLSFYYEARVILKAISWLGIKPKISNTIHFACPIKQINDLGININDLTGLPPVV